MSSKEQARERAVELLGTASAFTLTALLEDGMVVRLVAGTALEVLELMVANMDPSLGKRIDEPPGMVQ